MNQQALTNDIFNQAADAMTLIDSLLNYVSQIEEETQVAEADHAKRLTVMINERLASILGSADRLKQEISQ